MDYILYQLMRCASQLQTRSNAIACRNHRSVHYRVLLAILNLNRGTIIYRTVGVLIWPSHDAIFYV